ncbi:TetR/AcrR family transcriptional regulator [Actinospica robiniae]|uniref:TetR/AcrR family transcriptional regulator n=1 Tax=Actinospica robiniae TaxID=304901 RepID=UPI00040AC141|nr:TetR/AcrR family transcriptional regulator [Actinospica robiniae]
MTEALSPAPGGAGLRERKKQQTRDEIAAVATRLFVERGFEKVTIAQVAEAAGVAKMTVTNHFPVKEDLVFDRREAIIAGLTDAVAARAPAQSALEAARRFYLDALAAGDPTLAHRGPDFARLVESSPALVARERQMHDQRELALAEQLTHDMGAEPDDLRPRLAAAHIIGVIRVLYYEARRRLLAAEPAAPLAEALTRAANAAFDQFHGSLGDYGVKTEGADSA